MNRLGLDGLPRSGRGWRRLRGAQSVYMSVVTSSQSYLIVTIGEQAPGLALEVIWVIPTAVLRWPQLLGWRGGSQTETNLGIKFLFVTLALVHDVRHTCTRP